MSPLSFFSKSSNRETCSKSSKSERTVMAMNKPRAEEEEADVHACDDEVMVEKKEEEEVEVDEAEEVYHESEGLDEEMTDEQEEEEEVVVERDEKEMYEIKRVG